MLFRFLGFEDFNVSIVISKPGIVAQLMTHKPVNFASLTVSFRVSFSNYSNFDLECKDYRHRTAFRVRKGTGPFRDTGLWPLRRRQAGSDFCFVTILPFLCANHG